MLELFAQINDPISGGAGWVGAGLLGLVLAWLLLVHLPNKDKQMREILELWRLDGIEHRKSIEGVADKFEAALKIVTDHCEKDMERALSAFRAELTRRGDADGG